MKDEEDSQRTHETTGVNVSRTSNNVNNVDNVDNVDNVHKSKFTIKTNMESDS